MKSYPQSYPQSFNNQEGSPREDYPVVPVGTGSSPRGDSNLLLNNHWLIKSLLNAGRAASSEAFCRCAPVRSPLLRKASKIIKAGLAILCHRVRFRISWVHWFAILKHSPWEIVKVGEAIFQREVLS